MYPNYHVRGEVLLEGIFRRRGNVFLENYAPPFTREEAMEKLSLLKHLAILTPLSQITHAWDVKLSQLCDTGSHFKHVQNIKHLRSCAEVGESNYVPGLVYVVPGSIPVWRCICTTAVVLNTCWSYTDSWQLFCCLKAHDPCSRQQELGLMFPVWSSYRCTRPTEPSSRAGGFWLLQRGDLIQTGFSITS